MKTKNYIIIFIFSMICVNLFAENEIIDIKSNFKVSSNNITLEDFMVSPESLDKELTKLKVMNSPEDGDSITISLIDLAYKLQKYPELISLRLRGPDSIKINRNFNNKSVRIIKQKIIKSIKSIPPWKMWKIDVMFQSNDEHKLSSISKFDNLKLRVQDISAMLGSVPMIISFLDEAGIILSRTSISPVILREVNSIVLTDSHEKGYVLKKSDLQITPIWLGNENKKYMSDMTKCVDKELNRHVISGRILKKEYLLEPFCAKKGDLIWVVYKEGTLKIRIAVTTLQDGRLGDTIKVRNTVSKKVFQIKLNGEKSGVFKYSG